MARAGNGRIERRWSSAHSSGFFRDRRPGLLPLKTRPAKHWPALGRLKGDGGLRPAFRAGRPGFGANPRISAGALGFALFTTLGVVFELLIVEEELLARRKDEVSAAVNTLEDSICEFHGRLPNRGSSVPAMASQSMPSRSLFLSVQTMGPGRIKQGGIEAVSRNLRRDLKQCPRSTWAMKLERRIDDLRSAVKLTASLLPSSFSGVGLRQPS